MGTPSRATRTSRSSGSTRGAWSSASATTTAAWSLLGTALAVAGIAASLWLLRRRRDLVGLLGVSVLIGLVIYFLPTRVHERYLFGAIAFLAPLAVIERRLVWPFVALSAAVFLTVAYVAVTSPYRIFPGDKWDDFPTWAISLMSAATTAVGAWTAYRVVGLFGAVHPRAMPLDGAIGGAGVGWRSTRRLEESPMTTDFQTPTDYRGATGYDDAVEMARRAGDGRPRSTASSSAWPSASAARRASAPSSATRSSATASPSSPSRRFAGASAAAPAAAPSPSVPGSRATASDDGE